MGIPMNFYQPEWYSASVTSNFPGICYKRKFRWKFTIQDVSGDGVNSLPPSKGGRPAISFKEMQAEHLNETIFFPSKPEWKPITLTLYDIVKPGENPVFTWLRRAYDPANCSLWKPSLDTISSGPINGSLKCAQCFLNLYDGCGNIVEQWTFESAWPQSVEFGEGDMQSSDVITCDLTLRYDRAYISIPGPPALPNNMPSIIPNYNCSSVPVPSSNIPLSMVSFYNQELPEFVVINNPNISW